MARLCFRACFLIGHILRASLQDVTGVISLLSITFLHSFVPIWKDSFLPKERVACAGIRVSVWAPQHWCL
jgi:hypothetical protein